MKQIAKNVFRAYDLRGKVDIDFDEEWVERLGKALGTFFLSRGQQSAVVARDCRHSSPAYEEALIGGLLSTGVDVVSVGMVATPVFYFAVCHLNKGAGAVITASHNPSQYNGFKIWCGPTTIHTADVEELYDVMCSGDFATGEGIGSELDIVPSYIDAIAQRLRIKRPLKVVLDGGNGAGGLVCAEALRRVGCDVVEIFTEPDGSFPNHHPDPVVEKNMKDLQQAVREHSADLGIGLDGDGDRIGVVDANGRLLQGDELLCLFARDVLSREAGAEVIADVKCSHRLFDDIAKHGGKGRMCRTGHSVMKSEMLTTGAPLAGELSGHMYFNSGWYGFDDAIYAAAKLVEIISSTDTPLTELPGWPESFSTPEIQTPCPDNVKFAVVDNAREHFRKKYATNETDGVRITFPEGWGLVRASNTQPVLVMRFEASSQNALDAIQAEVEQAVAGWVKQLS